MDAQHSDLVTRCYRGGRYIVTADVLQSATPLVAALQAHGADDVMVLAGNVGVGPVPQVEVILLGTTGSSIMGAIRAFETTLTTLDDDTRAAIDAFDPSHEARVIGTPFTAHEQVADRAVHGARPASWRRLEDKTVIDALWDAAGVPRAPTAVVDVDRDALAAAGAALDAGDGVVWAADNREGFHGGATGLRRVRSPADIDDAIAHLGGIADRVRVMPFLDGLPCSIHGIVFDRHTVALRPCELVVLRRPGRGDLLYAGTASTWDPPAARRRQMRELAVGVGNHLRAAVGYRGTFTVDGIMTRDGFRPTELNPRFGAGANLLAAAAEVPLYLVHLAVIEHAPVDWRPARLGADIVAAADRTRGVRSFVLTGRPLAEGKVALAWDGDGLVRTAGGGIADVTLSTGSSAMGGAVQARVDAARHPTGSAAAPTVAAALRWADAEWDLGLGPLEPAPDLDAAP